jgi:hypothetical protein
MRNLHKAEQKPGQVFTLPGRPESYRGLLRVGKVWNKKEREYLLICGPVLSYCGRWFETETALEGSGLRGTLTNRNRNP